MDYQIKTHCPNCFALSQQAICPVCHFDRESYLSSHTKQHYLPLFTHLDKTYITGRVLEEGSFGVVYAAMREQDGLVCVVNAKPKPVKPHSFLHRLVSFAVTVVVLAGAGYGSLIAYQKYDLEDSENRKQDNLLFSQAQSIADYQNYLIHCMTCESKHRAEERITELQQEQRQALTEQKQREQDALLFSKAQDLAGFKAYLANCKVCADKAQTEEKIAQLEEEQKQADLKQLTEQEKEVLTSKGSGMDYYQQNCPSNIEFWQRTAESGYAIAQLLLGGCYRSGEGVKQDYAQSLLWYQKAAAQNNAYAQNNLALLYQNGYGIAKNEQEALKWYRKAAEQGLAIAQYNLGQMYQKGQGTAQSDKTAVDWYLRAAEQKNVDAQYSLGVMYHYGTGVEQDYQEAMAWYRKAAEQGHSQGQYMLGVMYENGYGVTTDIEEAINWYQQAADQGNADPIMQLKVLEAR